MASRIGELLAARRTPGAKHEDRELLFRMELTVLDLRPTISWGV